MGEPAISNQEWRIKADVRDFGELKSDFAFGLGMWSKHNGFTGSWLCWFSLTRSAWLSSFTDNRSGCRSSFVSFTLIFTLKAEYRPFGQNVLQTSIAKFTHFFVIFYCFKLIPVHLSCNISASVVYWTVSRIQPQLFLVSKMCK